MLGVVVRIRRLLPLLLVLGCSVYEPPSPTGPGGRANTSSTAAAGSAGASGSSTIGGGGSINAGGAPGITSAGGTSGAAGNSVGQGGGGAGTTNAGTGGGGATGTGGATGGGGATGSGSGGDREAGADVSRPLDSGADEGAVGPSDTGADRLGSVDADARNDARDIGPMDGRIVTEDPIDDMQDNNVPHYILPSNGRVGYWFTVNDSTDGGAQSPSLGMFGLSPGGYDTPYAAHLSGQGFSTWGIYMGFTLNKALQGARNTYDASAYVGISFWAKLGSTDNCTPPSSCRLVHLAISTRDTDSQGGVCTTACSDHFGYWQNLTTSWQKYTILFRQLAQDGWGVPGPAQGLKFDAAHAYEVQFQVKPAGPAFDFWIASPAFVLP
jgi:hypothetical protein